MTWEPLPSVARVVDRVRPQIVRLRVVASLKLFAASALAERAGRALFGLGLRVFPPEMREGGSLADDDPVGADLDQDPLTPEAADLLHRESTRMGAETFDGRGDPTVLEALGRNVNGPEEFVVGEKRVRRP